MLTTYDLAQQALERARAAQAAVRDVIETPQPVAAAEPVTEAQAEEAFRQALADQDALAHRIGLWERGPQRVGGTVATAFRAAVGNRPIRVLTAAQQTGSRSNVGLSIEQARVLVKDLQAAIAAGPEGNYPNDPAQES